MKKKRLIINLISNIISFAIQLGISFIITPIITEKVGTAAYGFIGLANNFVSYANIFTVIINSMASRFITVELTKKNTDNANKYFSSVLLMDIIMSSIITIFSVIIIIFLQQLIDIPNELTFDVKLTFMLAFINLIISIMSTVFTISTFAKNRLDLSAMATIVANVIKAILLIILFCVFTPKIYFITFTAIIYSIIIIIANLNFTKKLVPELEITVKHYDRKSIITIIKSGIWNSINSLGKTLLTGLDLLIANIFISPDAMGLISISKTIPTAIENLLVTISNIFLPQFIFYYSKRQIRKLVEYTKFSMKVIALIMIVPISGFIAFGTDFFSLWLPSKTQGEIELIQSLSILALIPYCISMGNYSLFLIDTVTNKLKRPVIATLIISIFSTITTIICLKFTNLGIYAVAGISSIFWAIKVFIFNTINVAKNLKIKWYTFYFQYLKNLFTFILVLIIFIIMKKFIIIESWKRLFIYAIIFAIIGYFIVFCLLFNKQEKNRIIKSLKERLGRKLYKTLIGLLVAMLIFLSFLSLKKEIRYVGNEGNKSLKLQSTNVSASDIKKEKYMHLSLDDVIEIFRDLTVNEERYSSIFDNKNINYLKKMHDLYNVKITCYVFYKNDMFSLDRCTDKYRDEFLKNSDWLRFGFHSIDSTTNYENDNNSLVNDYNRTIVELERIVGENSIDNCIRLANFKGNYNGIINLKNNSLQPIVGLLTADDLRSSYYLNEEQNKYIYCHDEMELDELYFISTDLRIEFINDVDEKIEELNTEVWNNQQNLIEIFSHEWCLDNINKNKMNKLLKKLKNKNYESEFFEDLIADNKFNY